VAHLSVTTKRADSACAYRATYVDGKLTGEPVPCAGVTGTTITAEDLFHNVATRRKALKSASDEHNRILDMLSRYALHNAGVAFTLRKQGENGTALQTLHGASVIDNVRQIFTPAVARELLTGALASDELKFDAEFYVTGPNYQHKKMIVVLFVNNRLVTSAALKRALDSVYQSYLPTGTHPFVFVRIKVDPANVDVNVHPTKEEVHILNEAEVISALQKAIDEKLSAHNASRTFTTTQTLLPGAAPPVTLASNSSSTSSTSTSSTAKRKERDDAPVAPTMVGLGAFQDATSGSNMQARGVRPEHMVRTDPTAQTLEALLAKRRSIEAPPPPPPPPPSEPLAMDEDVTNVQPDEESLQLDEDVVDTMTSPPPPPPPPQKTSSAPNKQLSVLSLLRSKSAMTPPSSQSAAARAPREVAPVAAATSLAAGRSRYVTSRLASVQNLLEDVNRQTNAGLQTVTRDATLVGSLNQRLMLWQHQTQLFVVDVCSLSNELFYQLVLQRFAQFARMRLSTALPIAPLILCALTESKFGRASYVESDGTHDEVAQKLASVLVERRELLSEYFAIDISADGELSALPVVLEQYVPDLDLTPLLLLRIASCVGWTSEQECFRTMARELADFFCLQPASDGESDEWLDGDDRDDGGHAPEQKARREAMEHVLFPALKRLLKPTARMVGDGSFVNVASLDKLYKVFERC
jgi:DNA mismatch repair protein MLH1